jgi:hypothetical protein
MLRGKDLKGELANVSHPTYHRSFHYASSVGKLCLLFLIFLFTISFIRLSSSINISFCMVIYKSRLKKQSTVPSWTNISVKLLSRRWSLDPLLKMNWAAFTLGIDLMGVLKRTRLIYYYVKANQGLFWVEFWKRGFKFFLRLFRSIWFVFKTVQ